MSGKIPPAFLARAHWCRVHLAALWLALLASSLLAGCGKGGPREDPRPVELEFLRAAVPESLLAFSHLEVAAREAVQREEEDGQCSLALTLDPAHGRANRGSRAEVSVDYPFTEGETVRYEWEFMFPSDFVADGPRNRWWLIAQWHDQPDRGRGETWEGHPARSPPLAISIGETNATRELMLALNYGAPRLRNFGPVPLRRGAWHRAAMVVTWSTTDAGRAAFFLDDPGHPRLTAEGANMHNRFQHYLKLGMYRHPDIRTRNTLLLRNLKIQPSPATPPGG